MVQPPNSISNADCLAALAWLSILALKPFVSSACALMEENAQTIFHCDAFGLSCRAESPAGFRMAGVAD